MFSKDKTFTLFLIDEKTSQKPFTGGVSILEDCVCCWLSRSIKSKEIYLCNCVTLRRWLYWLVGTFCFSNFYDIRYFQGSSRTSYWLLARSVGKEYIRLCLMAIVQIPLKFVRNKKKIFSQICFWWIVEYMSGSAYMHFE